jgi:hypothetical protein
MRAGACCALVICATAISGCDPRVGNAIASAESFGFSYQRMSPDANGNYGLRMNLGSGCRDYFFTAAALADALRTKQFPLTNPTRTANLTIEAIAECTPPAQHVSFDSAQLAEFARLPDGRPDTTQPRHRPKDGLGLPLVVAEFNTGGRVDAVVFGAKVIGNTVARTDAPGPLTLTTAEAPASMVNGVGDIYSHLNLNPQYVEARLVSHAANPDRYAVEFNFLAKTATGNDVLLVLDGSFVLRTDIEN